VSDRRSPAAAYKEVTAGIAAAAAELRERDATRVAELENALGRLDERMRRVGERTALTRFAVDLHWESVLEAMWSEPWMRVRPFPKPDPDADPAALDTHDRALHDAYVELMSLITRRRFGFRR